MDQWCHLEELQNTNAQQVHEGLCSIYRKCGILNKIRTLCPEFVENINRLPCEDESTAQQWMAEVLSCVAKLESEGNLAHQLEMQNLKTAVKERYGACTLMMIRDMTHCLEKERQLIQLVQQQDDRWQTLHQSVTTETIKSEIEKIDKARNALLKKSDELVKFHEAYKLMIQGHWLDGALIQEQDNDCTWQDTHTDQTLDLHVLQQETASQLEEMVVQLGDVCLNIWARVDQSTRILHLHLNDLAERPERSMEDLSEMCDMAGKLFCNAFKLTDKIREQLRYENDVDIAQKVSATGQTLQQLLKKHVNKVFIVHRPPPSIIQVGSGKSKGTSFPMGVCLLGAKSLGLHETPPKVSADLFDEKNLEKALADNWVAGMCQVTTNPKDKTMKLGPPAMAGDLVANFNKVSLDEVTLEGRTRGVAYILYFMVFHTELSVLGQTFTIQVLAPPVSLVSHHGYDCDARGRLVWNAAFPLENGKPFEDRQEVPWKEVASMLNHIFLVKTGKELNKQQLEYLGHTAFKMRSKKRDISDKQINRDQLIKTSLYEHTEKKIQEFCVQFSFWKWFSSCISLLRGPLKREWQDGFIYGFLGKNDAKKLLWDKADGTFLLRFCERTIEKSTKADNCGCLSVAVIATSDTRDVFYVREYLALKNITAEGENLAQILSTFDMCHASSKNPRLLHYLYPDTAFMQKEQRKSDGCESGYVKGGSIRRSIILTSNTSKSRVRAVPRHTPQPNPQPCLSLVVVSTDSHTGEQKQIPIKNNLTYEELHDIQQVVGSFDAMTIAGQTPGLPNALKRALKDPTEYLPQETQSVGERSTKHGRSNIYTDPNTHSSALSPPVSEISTSSDDLSSTESPDSPSLMQLPGNVVSMQSPSTSVSMQSPSKKVLMQSPSNTVAMQSSSNTISTQLLDNQLQLQPHSIIDGAMEEEAGPELFPDFQDLIQDHPNLPSMCAWELPPPLDAGQD